MGDVARVFDIVGDDSTVALRWGGLFYPFASTTLHSTREAAIAVALLRDGVDFATYSFPPEKIGKPVMVVTDDDMRSIGRGTH